MSQLRVENIAKGFKKLQVVKGISFSVKSSEVVGLLGPNGAGKTTSFYIVVGLLKPDRGEVFLDEREISSLPMYQRARIGLSYLPQEVSIFRRLTVAENILVALEAHGYTGSDKMERLDRLLTEFRIDHIRSNYGYSLSGGERRRVEISRALAGESKFLLLDEPFAGIDPLAAGDIQEVVLQLKAKGIGVLITDHNVRETFGICDRVHILKEGRIEVEGTTEEVAQSPVARKFYLGENFIL